LEPDFLIIGAGVAGLRAAIEAAEAGRVLVLTKDRLTESASEYAQGGIAVALSDDDRVSLHEQDTINAGDGLCDPQAVRVLVEQGPQEIQQLIEWGVEFDREGTRLTFTREGAHSRNRVLHAHGDSTGREIARTLFQKARSIPNITFQSFSAVVDLLTVGGEVCGAAAWNQQERRIVPVRARAVLLATGGLGSVYWETTNPDVATGDGVAMAYRAGAEVADIEMVQFHPTALFLEGAPRFLLSEALRGEGAYLRNAAGERFMERYSERGELAPRDVVSRAIIAELHRTQSGPVYLDLTHLDAEFVSKRFPRIHQTCLHYGVDMARQPVPVHPAAHYAMGGVETDYEGRTNLPGLFAAGEVAACGVHGANRLASNSLLEGIVYGARAGRRLRERAGAPLREPDSPPHGPLQPLPANVVFELRRLAWRRAGIERSRQGLESGLEELARLGPAFESPHSRNSREGFEADNMYQVISLIVRCALARQESRGCHYRSDYPRKDPRFQKHSRVSKQHEVEFAAVSRAA
jgi:L-aspartate oxidase